MRKGNPKDEPRRQILRALITENGEHAEFVKRFNLKPSQASHISQIVNGYSFGERAAENMRVLLNLPAGFFNVEDKDTSGNISSTLSGIQRRALKLLEEMDSKARAAWFAVGASLAKSDKSAVNDLSKPQSAHGVNEGRAPVESAPAKSWPGVERRKKDVGFTPDRRRRHFGIPDMKRLPKKSGLAPKRGKK